MRFEASGAVLWSLSCYKELKLTTKPFTGRTLCSLLIQMQKLAKFRHAQKATFQDSFYVRLRGEWVKLITEGIIKKLA